MKPTILFVDDHPDEVSAFAMELSKSSRTEVSHPNDLEPEQVERANLVLVDQRLDDWPEREKLPMSLRPMTGVALAAILRARPNVAAPTGFAILSAHLADLAGDLPIPEREHSVARAHNLEWVFQKTGAPCPQILQLAVAVASLPDFSKVDSSAIAEKILRKLFRLTKNRSWSDRALRQIESCRPPIHDLAKPSHGLSIVRWFFQQILPYPTFLLDEYHLAARCGVALASLKAELARQEGSQIDFCEYRGIGSTFLGRRWWRAGIEEALWRASNEGSFGRQETAHQLFPTAKSLTILEASVPVVSVTRAFQPEEIIDVSKAVRIQPDDWPGFADDAWVKVSTATEDSQVRALVLDSDRERLG